ncbi:MAG: hypothetical protein IJD04_04835 [Desulfovibrionaceae bacterium]|nr:hypothetical protein [Desulfovibrionaceae bacterium]
MREILTCGNCAHFGQYRGCDDGECTCFSGIPAEAGGLVYLATGCDVEAKVIGCRNWEPSDAFLNELDAAQAEREHDCLDWYRRRPGCPVPPEDNCYI